MPSPMPFEGSSPLDKSTTAKRLTAMMMACWQKTPTDRPRFIDLTHLLEELVNAEMPHTWSLKELCGYACVLAFFC